MGVRDRAFSAIARQLGHPSGLIGRIVGRALNRGNRGVVEAAISASQLTPNSVAADVGFGGGASLPILLNRTAPSGVVHGIEMSPTMVAQTRRRFAQEVAEGRLQLHDASMSQLPLPDDCFDAVISTNTIYFIDDLHSALTELARVTKPGGRIVLGIGDPDAMADMPFTKHGFRLRPIHQIVDHFSSAGLRLVEDVHVGDDTRPFHLIIAEIDTA